MQGRGLTSLALAVALSASACAGSAAVPAAVDYPTLDDPTPVDRWSVPDPGRIGRVPVGYHPVLARDDILPVYRPQFVAAESVDWDGDSLVIGVALGGVAKAYPLATLTRREMVLDHQGGVPTLVSWCPLCGSATVHRREVEGVELVLGNQGALWGNAMTWWDHDTGTIWSQPLGEAILGDRIGARLELLPSMVATWEQWRADHPETLALFAPNGSIGRTADDFLAVVEIDGDATAFALSSVRDTGTASATLAGTPIVVVAGPEGEGWQVFGRRIDGVELDLDLVDGVLIDASRARTFDPVTGRELAGDARLVVVPAFTIFADDYRTFFPEGRRWTPD